MPQSKRSAAGRAARPCYAPCEACGSMVLTGVTAEGHRLALDPHVKTYMAQMDAGEGTPRLVESRGYTPHVCHAQPPKRDAEFWTLLARSTAAHTAALLRMRRLKRDLHTLTRERDQLRARVRDRDLQVIKLHRLFLQRAQGARGLPAFADLLKPLLRLAHPDKWSQGQPATELAHEVLVYLNTLREEA